MRDRKGCAANESINLGWGSISTLSKSTELSRNTFRKGIKEIRDNSIFHLTYIRKWVVGEKARIP